MTSGIDEQTAPDGLIACHECDALHRLQPLKRGERAHCLRCDALLYRDVSGRLDEILAFSIAALLLFAVANSYPFISLKLEGRVEENLLTAGIFSLWQAGQPGLAVLVALTSVIFPALTILGMLWLLVPLRFGMQAPGTTTIYSLIQRIGPWTLLGVFMLGVFVAIVKLMALATVIPGLSMYAYVGLMLCTAAATARFDSSLLWPARGPHLEHYVAGASARDLGFISCHTCNLLLHAPELQHGAGDCPRCGAALHGSRKHNSITRTWALVISASLLIIPANVYPVMTVIRFGQGEPNTILSGVVYLIGSGMWGLALIVFLASIVIPVLKLSLLSILLVSIQRGSIWRPKERTRLYRITEIVGAWSMVDVFLVGVLSALVQLDALSTIEPGIGASFFGATVVITMFAAQSFDPRLIWDYRARSP